MSVSIDTGFDLTDPSTYWRTAKTVFRAAIWAEDPLDQVVANTVIIIAAVLSSAVTWGAGLLIAGVALVFWTIGIVRLAIALLR
jgi:hypothetical protein